MPIAAPAAGLGVTVGTAGPRTAARPAVITRAVPSVPMITPLRTKAIIGMLTR